VALKAVAGKGLRNILAGLTGNRYLGALTGALVTAVIQSSSVTTVLVVGFVSTQLMSLTQAIGVIIGANRRFQNHPICLIDDRYRICHRIFDEARNLAPLWSNLDEFRTGLFRHVADLCKAINLF